MSECEVFRDSNKAKSVRIEDLEPGDWFVLNGDGFVTTSCHSEWKDIYSLKDGTAYSVIDRLDEHIYVDLVDALVILRGTL